MGLTGENPFVRHWEREMGVRKRGYDMDYRVLYCKRDSNDVDIIIRKMARLEGDRLERHERMDAITACHRNELRRNVLLRDRTCVGIKSLKALKWDPVLEQKIK